MKRFDFLDNTHMFVGEAEEIKPLYRSMERAFDSNKSNYCPMSYNTPRFNPYKMYGLMVNENGFFFILSEHVALQIISTERFTVKG